MKRLLCLGLLGLAAAAARADPEFLVGIAAGKKKGPERAPSCPRRKW